MKYKKDNLCCYGVKLHSQRNYDQVRYGECLLAFISESFTSLYPVQISD